MIFPRSLSCLHLVLLLLLAACGPKTELVSIIWTNEKATRLVIRHLAASEADLQALEVRLVPDNERAAVLGKFSLSGDEVTFTPIVPLTRGRTYELLEDGNTFGEITIPVSDAPDPKVVGIYPSVDTIPENLLKVHIQFSRPMMEGKSGQLVKLLENGKDTLNGTFLDLQPELWNEDGTTLTLWLDPGRIKLDLIPNQELGNPLTKGAQVALVILPGWSSKDGLQLRSMKLKSYFVGRRDDQSPGVDNWKMEIPASNTKEPLTVSFGEPLDRVLAGECLHVVGESSALVPGTYTLNDDVGGLVFVPEGPWRRGAYSFTVESRLEDLAGNNLNRLFEVDLNKPGAKTEQKRSHTRTFIVK